MRNFCVKCVCILILQFVLITTALANTLTLGEQGEVLAETDRYRVRFKDGVLVHFHNKLTQETYTLPPKGPSNTQRGLLIQYVEGRYGRDEPINERWDVETQKLSPLAIEIAYHSDYRTEKTVRLRIAIEPETQDLVIHQSGTSAFGGLVGIMWGCGYLNSQKVNLILPANGGQVINDTTEFGNRSFKYPGRWWEAQLAILQGGNGGFFVRSTDTTYRFKEVHYVRNAEDFGMSFKTHNFAPFRDKHEITSAAWRLNAYRGNWKVPAEIYRNWMEKVFQPKQPPAWVKELELVIYFSNMNINTLSLLASHVNPSKTLLYLTNWRTGGWDENFPDYTPRSEFGDILKAAHAYGFPVMIHASFHGCSTYHPRYPAFEKHQFRHTIKGDKLGWEGPTNQSSFAYINPASNAFRKYIVAQLKKVYETYPIEVFHLDTNHFIENDANGLIDGLTAAEGNVLLHQELAAAIPGVVFGGEHLHEVTFPHVNLAQRANIPHDAQPHPISSFLFLNSTIPYGFHVPNPDIEPEFYQPFEAAYRVWDILPTIRIRKSSNLHSNMIYTLKKLANIRTGYFWDIFSVGDVYSQGDVNEDGRVNVLDLVMVAQHIGTEKPSNPKVDVNGDGIVNILDLVIVANAF